MKFIHTSDWHIGRFFQNISLLDDQKLVLNQIKLYVQDNDIEVIIVSGDIYDRSVPPADAIDVLNQFLQSITIELSIPVIMISGNHDSAKRLAFGAKQMTESGLHILSRLSDVITPVIINSSSGPVHFYGIPYHDPVEVREAFNCDVKTYDEAHTYLVNLINTQRDHTIPAVLMSHCFIDGAEESDSERPLSIGGADRVSYQALTDFDYVALGHLHAPQFKGEPHIRYSGSILKYSFSEYKQLKSMTVVEMNQQGLVGCEQVPLQPKHNLRVIEGALETVLHNAKVDPNKEDYLLIRLTDKHDLLDPIGQLRQVYPNVLQLERAHFSLTHGSGLIADVSLKRSESDVFNDFFQQVTGNELTEQQQHILLETIEQVKAQHEDSL
jgi:exonuclease SbcD